MKSKKLPLLFLNLLFLGHCLHAQSTGNEYEHLLTPVNNYMVYQASNVLVMDGKADEPDWEYALWSDDFLDIEGNKKPKPLLRTRVKMLYDQTSLYVLAELEEPHVWATYNTHDQIIYHENDIEVFIDPDGDTHNYYEYELNALNTLLDLKMPMPYRNGGLADIHWNSKGFKSAVFIDGTLNDPTDTDNKWTVEMKIPFADLEVNQVPGDGQIWKVNFSRVQWRIQDIGGKYEKLKNPSTGRAYPENNWVWSPPGLINMHYPERWGMIQFSKIKVGRTKVDFKMPEEEAISRTLWEVYYKQQNFKRKNNRYANNLIELEISQEMDSLTEKIIIKATLHQLTVQAVLNDGSVLSINEKGLFLKNKIKTHE